MKDLLLRHGEKVVVLIVLLLCGFWIMSGLNRFRTETGKGSKVSELVGKIEKYLDEHKAPKMPLPDFDEKMAGIIECCDALTVAQVPPRIFWALPGKGEGPTPFSEKGALTVPAGVRAEASRGEITLSWSLDGTPIAPPDNERLNACIPQYFEIFRWVEQEEAGEPKEPYAVVQADWPVSTGIPSISTAGAGQPVPGQPGMTPQAASKAASAKTQTLFMDVSLDNVVSTPPRGAE